MRESDAVLAKGADELSDIIPRMLKKRVAAFVFLPWLSQYTQRVRDAAKIEEREAILSISDLPEEAKTIIRGWMQT